MPKLLEEQYDVEKSSKNEVLKLGRPHLRQFFFFFPLKCKTGDSSIIALFQASHWILFWLLLTAAPQLPQGYLGGLGPGFS